MSDKLEEFYRQTLDEIVAETPAEVLLKRMSVADRLKGLSAEELIRALPSETLEALTRQLKANVSSAKPQ